MAIGLAAGHFACDQEERRQSAKSTSQLQGSTLHVFPTFNGLAMVHRF
jgi:hypothetical protein